MTDVRSVTGVYMMPLGLPLDRRRSASASRMLILIPDKGDDWKLFKLIEGNLVTAATEGIVTVDPYGATVQVFVDMVSFFGDYPAVTAMSDLRGHTGLAFCTFCSMRKREDECGRNLLYSSQMHSRRL